MFPEDSEADLKSKTGILAGGNGMSNSCRFPKELVLRTLRDVLLSRPELDKPNSLEWDMAICISIELPGDCKNTSF